MPELSSYRQEIDTLDREIIELLGKRFAAVRQVGIFKKEHNLPPLQSSRWAEVIKTRTAWAVEQGLSPAFIEQLWDKMHTYALEEEEKISK